MADETKTVDGVPWRQDDFGTVRDGRGARVRLFGFSMAGGVVQEDDDTRKTTALVIRAVNAYNPMRERLASAQRALDAARATTDPLRFQALATQALEDVAAALRAADGEGQTP